MPPPPEPEEPKAPLVIPPPPPPPPPPKVEEPPPAPPPPPPRNDFWKDVFLCAQFLFLLMLLLLLLLFPEVICGPTCPAVPAPVAHHYGGKVHVYTDAQKAMWSECDVMFAHSVPSGNAVLRGIFAGCKGVQAKAHAVGGHHTKDYVKTCVIHGTKKLADDKADDGKEWHQECVDYITQISKNETLLSLAEGAHRYAHSGQFQGTNRQIVAAHAVQMAIEEAKNDALQATVAKKYAVPPQGGLRGGLLTTAPIAVALTASCVFAVAAVVGMTLRRRSNRFVRLSARAAVVSLPLNENEC